jgi:hypothetical protein
MLARDGWKCEDSGKTLTGLSGREPPHDLSEELPDYDLLIW